MKLDIFIVLWIVVAIVGLPLCVVVRRRKARYLKELDGESPPAMLSRLIVSEETVRILMLLSVFVSGVLAILDNGKPIIFCLYAIDFLIIGPPILWLKYENSIKDWVKVQQKKQQQEQK